MPPIDAVTRDDLAYLRAARPQRRGLPARQDAWPSASAGATPTTSCSELAGRVRGLAELAQDVRTLFNNNRGDDAPDSARADARDPRPGPGPVARPAAGDAAVGQQLRAATHGSTTRSRVRQSTPPPTSK